MTTVHSMTFAQGLRCFRPGRHRLAGILLLTIGVLIAGGCENYRTLHQPNVLVSPYLDGTTGEIVWAVAPLRNLSGTSIVDELIVTDELVQQIQQIHGISAIPVNQTLAAMRVLNLPSIETPEEALLLAQALGADAVIAGTITAWHAYDPLEIGLSIALFSRDDAVRGNAQAQIDPRALEAASTDQHYRLTTFTTGPLSVVAEHLDASNHQIVAAARQYAQGRHEQRSAFGDDRYVKVMESYTQFACFYVVDKLLANERSRLAEVRQTQQVSAR